MADCDRHYSADREALAKAYPGKKWRDKVLKMSDAQVFVALANVRRKNEKKAKKKEQEQDG